MIACASQNPTFGPSSGAQVVCVNCFGGLHIYLSSGVSSIAGRRSFLVSLSLQDLLELALGCGNRHIRMSQGDWLPVVVTSTSQVIFITLLAEIVDTWGNYL